MDRKLLRVLSTATDPTSITTVQRRQKDGSRVPIPCPECVKIYNEKMGGVDRGDQLRGYYRCRTKFRKFYMYIFCFLFDVMITNSFILHKNYSPSPTFKTIKDFRMKLAQELIGDYCSRRRPGCRSSSSRPFPLKHFPTKREDRKRGRCKNCQKDKRRTDTTWFCTACNEWLCHDGNPTSDCYLIWHKRQDYSHEN